MCKVSDETFSELRIAQAYIRLSGANMVSLAWIGSREVRMFEGPQIGSAHAPLFWIELFDHSAQVSIDSCGCHEIEDARVAFEDFISQAQCSNGSFPREREGTRN